MKKITLVISIFAFFLFRPYQMQNSGMMYTGDDYSYMAHATSLVFLEFPSYSKEYFTEGKGIPLHPIGASILASPFVFLGSIVDRISGDDIVVKRTPENVFKSWAAFGFSISSLFYLWIACLLLYRGLSFYFDEKISSLTVILAVLVQGGALYVFRRPVFSHIYELFLQSLFLFLLLRFNKFGGRILPVKKIGEFSEPIFIGLLAGFIVLVRVNNIFMSLAWPVVLFSLYYPQLKPVKIIRMIIVSYFSMLVLIFIFQVYPILHNLQDPYQYRGYFSHELVKSHLLTFYNPVFYVMRLGHLFFGLDWGLIFTAPYLVFGLLALMWNKKDKITTYLIWLLLPIAVNLYLTLVHGQQGSWYGYRYLIFSFIPIIVYPLAQLFVSIKSKPFLYYVTILMAILPIISMLSFESNNTNLTLNLGEQGFGAIGWGNNVYQLEIYQTMLTSPIQYLVGIFKGGALYFVYLLSIALGLNKYLPAVIYEKYAVFQIFTLIKVIIVYLLPFALLWVYKKKNLWLRKSWIDSKS